MTLTSEDSFQACVELTRAAPAAAQDAGPRADLAARHRNQARATDAQRGETRMLQCAALRAAPTMASSCLARRCASMSARESAMRARMARADPRAQCPCADASGC